MIPELTTCPASDVPPALRVTLDFSLVANCRISLISDIVFGQATAEGSSL